MSSRICYFDAFSGVSGDMLVGSLVDAGAPSEAVAEAVHSLGTGATVSFEKVKRHGIGATKFHVEGGEQKAHRHLPQIVRMIEGSSLPDRAKKDAEAVFRKLGEAEAAVHNVPIERVHFHEVGAFDSIADIVGACLGLSLLGIEEVYCSPLNVGSGTVKTEHGILPVPAPATARLLEGRPLYSAGPPMELTTPTGAAVVSTLSRGFGTMPAMTIETSGFGAGTREFAEQANVLRVLVGRRHEAAEAAEITVIEANLDDLTPQVLGYAMERILEAGALDATLQPLQMKKNRAGHLLSVLARPEDADRLASVIFAETSTIGLRMYRAQRRVQERRWVEVPTPWGGVRIKVAGENFAPEYDDCRRLAEEHKVALKQVIAEASYQYLKQIKP